MRTVAFATTIAIALLAGVTLASTRSFIETVRGIGQRVEACIYGEPPIERVTQAWLQDWTNARLSHAYNDYFHAVVDGTSPAYQQQKAIELAACAVMIAARIEEGR